MLQIRCKKLAAFVAMQALAGIVNAQTGTIDEIVVTSSPIRDSAMASIEAKRAALNYMDAIAADNIGRFPDQNLADSLGRLPGLAIERDQGQARYINLRGAPFRYTTIAFDGINVPGAEGGRVPRFDSFPAVITSRLEANKAILPSMPGESVAGFINVRTFSAFDKEGVGIATDFGQGQQSLGDGDVSKYSLRGSWSGDSVGFTVFASENKREQVTDNREYDLARDAGGQLVVNELDFRSYFVDRSDKAQGGSLEYRGDGMLQSAFVRTLYSEFVDAEERNQHVFTVRTPKSGVSGTAAVSINRLLEDGLYENSTDTSTLGVDLALDAWKVDLRYNRTETGFTMDLPIPYSRSGSATATYDLSSLEDPIVSLDRSIDAVVYPLTLGLYYVQSLDVQTDKFKLDASRDFEWFGQAAVLQIGGQIDTREGAGYVATPVTGGFPSSINIAAYDTGKPWYSNTTNSIGASYYDNVGLRNAWIAAGGLKPPVISAANQIAIEEDIDAFYAMTTTELDWGNVVLGARYEQTGYTSTGNSTEGPVSVSDDFSNFLPSAHVNIDLADDLKLRLSASTGLSRPTYNEWRAAATVDAANKQVRGGNPTLKAEKSRGFDTSLEWYFADASILSVGAFTRYIDNVIYADSSPIDAGVYLPSAAGQQWTYTGSVNGDDGRMTGVELNFTGSAADVLPEPFDGFGLSANLTALDTEFQGNDGVTYGLPGTSDLIYNVSVFYEKYDLSLRLNYQWRDQWISPLEDPSEFWGEQQRVDLTALYKLPFDLQGATASVYLNLNNLMDETDLRFAGNGTVNQSESYGRHWLMGIRINY